MKTLVIIDSFTFKRGFDSYRKKFQEHHELSFIATTDFAKKDPSFIDIGSISVGTLFILSSIISGLLKVLPISLLGIKSYIHYLKYEFKKQRIRNFISINNIEKVILYDDRSFFGLQLAALNAASELGIDNIILQVAYPTSYLGIYEYRKNKNEFMDQPFISRMNDNQIRNINNKKLSFYPSYLAYHLRSIVDFSENPWVIGGSGKAKVFLKSEYFKSLIKSQGICESKLKTIGTNENLSIDVEKKYDFVFVVPQAYEHGLLSWGEVEKLIKEVLEFFQKNNYTALVSLHPKMNIKRYSFIEELGFNISLEKLVDIISYSSSYIGSYSTTLEWAIYLQMNIYILDIYENKLDMYPGIIDECVYKNMSDITNNIPNEKLSVNPKLYWSPLNIEVLKEL